MVRGEAVVIVPFHIGPNHCQYFASLSAPARAPTHTFSFSRQSPLTVGYCPLPPSLARSRVRGGERCVCVCMTGRYPTRHTHTHIHTRTRVHDRTQTVAPVHVHMSGKSNDAKEFETIKTETSLPASRKPDRASEDRLEGLAPDATPGRRSLPAARQLIRAPAVHLSEPLRCCQALSLLFPCTVRFTTIQSATSRYPWLSIAQTPPPVPCGPSPHPLSSQPVHHSTNKTPSPPPTTYSCPSPTLDSSTTHRLDHAQHTVVVLRRRRRRCCCCNNLHRQPPT